MKVSSRGWLVLLALFVALHAMFLFPDFFSPYDSAQQNRDFPFAPPTKVHFIDQAGHLHLTPFVYGVTPDDGDSYKEDRSLRYPIKLFVEGARYRVLGLWTASLHLFGTEKPSQIFLFGTDDFGRDQFSRMLSGGQISLLAGILAATLAIVMGGMLGILAGFFGGRCDEVVMRVAELFLALPWLYLLFAVRAVLPLHIKTTETLLLLVAVVGFVGWARPARLVRGVVLSAKERNFVLAATAMGASRLHLLRRHILPETYPVLLTTAALLVPQFILAEVTLSFLGLGVGEPMASWGNLLAQLQNYRVLTSYWWMYLPAAMLVLVFLGYNWASSALQARVGEVRA
jgi:peptide/nickel transport system permease protein